MSFTVSIKFKFYGHFSGLRALLGFMRILIICKKIFVLLGVVHILRNHRGRGVGQCLRSITGGGSANAYVIFCSIMYGKKIRLRRRRDFFFGGISFNSTFKNFFLLLSTKNFSFPFCLFFFCHRGIFFLGFHLVSIFSK